MARTTEERQQAAGRIAARLAERDPTESDWRDGAPLHRLAETFRRSVEAEAELAEAVKAARAEGCSWAAIGSVPGVTKQTAQTRYCS